MVECWKCPVRAGDGLVRYVELDDATQKVRVRDFAGAIVLVPLSPNVPPPTGKVLVRDFAGATTLISLVKCSPATHADLVLTVTQEAQALVGELYDNFPTVQSPPHLVWVELGVDRLIGHGSLVDYEMSGELIVEHRVAVMDGEAGALGFADTLVTQLSGKESGGVRYGAAYVERVGRVEETWSVRTRAPFFAVREVVRATLVQGSVSTYLAAENAAMARFKVEVADVLALPTEYPNFPPISKPEGLWARVSVLWPQSAILERGATRRGAHPGVMIVQLFAPVMDGVAGLYAVADLIDEKFRTRSAAGVTYGVPTTARIGRVDEGDPQNQGSGDAVHQINVDVPMTFQKAG